MMNKNILFLLFFISITTSCIGGRNSSIKARHSFKSDREVIFVNADSMVYFIKPILMKSEKKNSLMIDYTYLFSKKSPNNPVKISFTIYSKTRYDSLEAIKLVYNNNQSIEIKEINMMFQEKKGSDKYLIRYNFWVDKKRMEEVSKSSSLELILNNNEGFKASDKKWKRLAEVLNQSLQNM
ncbi:MAG: hypothetical protein IT238_09795 [Bacteroidia bacterium]|nr:hypothetical protein [Bacteroidia bacterium]MCZ2247317.1 hypothetical protein [Bacteroidia bacterium]